MLMTARKQNLKDYRKKNVGEMMISLNEVVMVVVDVQEKLIPHIWEKEKIIRNIQILIKGLKILNVPILLTEQYPEGLGKTIPQIREIFSEVSPISKMTFDCSNNKNFMEKINGLNRKQVLLCGIETHVCIYQTAIGLRDAGYEVQVVADSVSSRTEGNKEIALQRMRDSGVGITSVETVLFELLKTAEGRKFKEILKLVR